MGNIKDQKTKDQGISKQLKIEHDETEQWFTLDLPKSGGQAFLQYSIEDDGKLDFWHTEVPEAARGAGVGGQLAKAALDWAAGRKNPGDQADSGTNDDEAGGEHTHQQHVILSCSFLNRWHQLNPTPEHIAVVVEQ